jgi:hypothetical protein
MKKLNVVLSLAIITVLLVPGFAVGSIVSACCGVEPINLVVTDAPDPVECGANATISGTYTVTPTFDPFEPYDTGVVIRVWDPDGVGIVDKSVTLATGETVAPKDFTFSEALAVTECGTYTYEVVAWSVTSYGRMEINFVGGTITVIDVIPPVVEAGPDVTVEQTSYEGAPATLPTPVVTDNCDPSPVVVVTGVMDIYPLGDTTITVTATDDSGNSASDTLVVHVVDTTPPELSCVEAVNPDGKNIPTAKNNNQDGFYQLFTTDICDSAPQIYVGTAANPMLFGPFASGIVIKFTEDPTVAPECKKIGSDKADAVTWHIILPEDPLVTAVDLSSNSSTCVCLVPPPPK